MKKLYMTFAAALLAAPAMFAQDQIYLVGQPSGWNEPSEANEAIYSNWTLPAVEDGVKVYEGRFNINAGEFQLRFYSDLTGWDGGASIGSQVEDNPITFDFTDDQYSSSCVAPGKGSWQAESWLGGEVRFVVNLYENKVTFLYGDAIDNDVPFEVPEGPGPAEPQNVTIYVNNQAGWNTVYLYMWGDINDLGSSWPGILPSGTTTVEGYECDFLYYELGDQAYGLTENLIFNNGEGVQLPDYNCVLNKDYYFVITAEGVTNLEGDDVPEGPGPVEPSPSVGNWLYVVGDITPNGWTMDAADWKLYESEENVFIGSYYVNAGALYFRFYKEIGDWDSNSIGAQEADEAITIELTDGVYEGPCVWGKGSWNIESWLGGDMTFCVDLNNMTVKFEEGVSEEAAGVKAVNGANLNLRYNAGVISANEATDFVVINMAGQVVARSFGESIDLNGLGKGVYAVSANGNVLKVVR